GTPLAAGEFSLQLRYLAQGQEQSSLARLQLAVVQDPKNLWKNLPSDSAGLFASADTQVQQQAGLIGASTRGRSHAHVGGYRDDAFAIEALASGWQIVIVADGAGSARYSRRGAELICQTAASSLRAQLTGPIADSLSASSRAWAQEPQSEELQQRLKTQLAALLGQAAYQALAAIHAQASELADSQVKDFASTALIGLCRHFPTDGRGPGGSLCACYWVGDGAAAVYSQGRGVRLLGLGDSGEFAGQTRFLDASAVSNEVITQRTCFAWAEDLTAFILMSDGVSDAKFPTAASLASLPHWDTLWAELNPLLSGVGAAEALLEWLNFWSPGNHDDRTLVLALPPGQKEPL
ncbi:MAG TPA: PP2C family serine/threonine-protein phosphatase, partial [Cellvibrionaceae bacterium]|nr:PP2C family serine/threonine-protein phosphatase [Cellvibrionaceae bacterium]